MLRTISYGLLWTAWVALILMIVLPWQDLRDHTHWGKVAWIPFVSPPVKASDITANLLLYVPFGYFGVKTINRNWARIALVIAAGLLSFSTETVQLYSHRRFPSATDLTCNITGCLAGLYFALPSRRRSAFRLPQEIPS